MLIVVMSNVIALVVVAPFRINMLNLADIIGSAQIGIFRQFLNNFPQKNKILKII
jgi:hypothetical protein